MASFKQYTASGGASEPFSIKTFTSDEIKVYVAGVLKTASTHYNITSYTANGGTVTWTSGNIPSSGTVVRIIRDTKLLNNAGDTVEGKATYVAGASVKAEDLNDNQTQVLRSLEEQDDQGIQTYDLTDNSITGAKLAHDTITHTHIAANAIGASELADDSVNFANIIDGAVRTAGIQDDAITTSKIAGGAVTGPKLPDGVITSAKIATSAVTSGKIAPESIVGAAIVDEAIDSRHYVDGSVGTVHIADNAITSAKIAGGAVNTSDIADVAVTTAKIADSNVTTTKLATNAVTTVKISDGTITTAKLASGLVTTDKLGNDSVTNAKIADDSIDSEQYVDGSIDTAHLSNSAVTNAKLASNSVSTVKISDNNITEPKIANDAIRARHINDGEIVTAALATNSVTSAKINDGHITTTKIADDAVRANHIHDGQVLTAAINDNAVTADKIADSVIVTASEQAAHSVNDTSFFTTSAAEARFFNASTGETIKDGQSFPDNDTTIATTAAINDRIIDLVDDVGGFVPIANETSFPNANPDVNNGTGTLVSIKALASNLTSNGSGVATIANGTVGNSTVTITGLEASTTYNSGYGLIVETTSTLNTYTFHRQVPKATEVTTVAGSISNVNTVAGSISNVNAVAGNASNINAVAADATDIGAVAGKATEIGRLGTADAVADLAILGTADVVSDLNTLGTADIVSDMNTLAVSGVISDMDTCATNVSNINTTAGSISNVNTTAGSIANVNTVASNMSTVNDFAARYRVGSSNPSTSLDTGDLFFNTSANELKVYNGSAWQGGVTATGSFAVVTGNTFTGENKYNDSVKAKFGTGSDLQIYHNGTNSFIDNTTGYFRLKNTGGFTYIDATTLRIRNSAGDENQANFIHNGAVELHYDGGNNSSFKTTSYGSETSGQFRINNWSGSQGLWVTRTDADPGASVGVQIVCDSTKGFIKSYGANLRIQIAAVDGTASNAIVIDQATKDADFYGDINVLDNKKLLVGTGDDLKIYHDGSNTHLENNTGVLNLRSTGNIVLSKAYSETLAVFTPDGANELYYDNVKKLNTHADGVEILGKVYMADSKNIELGSSQDLKIYHNGADSIIHNATGDLVIRADSFKLRNGAESEKLLDATADGAVALYHNNVKTLQTDGNGIAVYGPEGGSANIYLYADEGDDNADKFQFTVNEGGPLLIQNRASGGVEENIKCYGNGAVELYYDDTKRFETGPGYNLSTGDISPSASGTYNLGGTSAKWNNAYFAGNVYLYDSDKLLLGDGSDLQIYHSGDWNHIQNHNSKNLAIQVGASGDENAIIAIPDGAVQLYYNNIKALVTKSNGIQLYGPEGTDCNIDMYADDGDDNDDHWRIVATAANQFGIYNTASGSYEKSIIATGNGNVELYYDNTKKFETSSSGATITSGHFYPNSDDTHDLGLADKRWRNLYLHDYLVMPDNGTLQLGSGDDLKIYHNGNHNYIDSANGNVYIRAAGGENMAIFAPNGAVNLYYDNSIRLSTSAGGVSFTNGHLTGGDNNRLRLGASADLDLFHDSANSYVNNVTGWLLMQGDSLALRSYTGGENYLTGEVNGSTKLYYNNSLKLETVDNGLIVYGPENGDGVIHLRADEGDDNADKWKLNAAATGYFYLENATSGSWETSIRGLGNGAVDLYYDNSLKLSTDSTGIWVNGALRGDTVDLADSKKILLGTGDDLEIFHDGSDSFITNATGGLNISSPYHVQLRSPSDEMMFKAAVDSDCKLYYDNSEKLKTTSWGVQIVQAFLGAYTNYPDSDYPTPTAHILQASDNGSAAVRIEHSNNHNPYGLMIDFSDDNPDNNTNWFLSCHDSSAMRMRVYSDGDIDNHDNSYGGTSDVKLKENIVDASSQWDDVKAVKVRKFNFKADTPSDKRLGVIAQEIETISPGLVDEHPDLDKNENALGTTTKSVKYSILYMKAFKALQEAMAKIEVLETKVAALESS